MAETARLFMKLTDKDGKLIPGESQVVGMKGWIEMDDWNWSLRNKSPGSGVEPSQLTFSKMMDRASTRMLMAMHKGEPLSAMIKLDDASLTLVNLTLHLEKVRVIRHSFSAQSTTKHITITEDWEFDYESILFEYRQDLVAGAVETQLFRPPGSSTESPDDDKKKFMALFKDFKAEDMEGIWQEVVAKTRDLPKLTAKPPLDITKDGKGK